MKRWRRREGSIREKERRRRRMWRSKENEIEKREEKDGVKRNGPGQDLGLGIVDQGGLIFLF